MKEEIQKTIKLDNGDKIILFNSDTNKGKVSLFEYNRNIVKLNNKNELLWRIKIPGDDRFEIPFIKMKLREKKLIAYDWAGGEYEVDLDDGSIKLIREHR